MDTAIEFRENSMQTAPLRFRELAVLVLIMLATGFTAFAADIDGTWTATFDTQIGEQHYTYTFKADGDKLTGTAKNDMGETPIEDGTIKGNDISFTENLKFEGQTIPIKYKGQLAGDQINFTREVGTFATEKLVAKRLGADDCKPSSLNIPGAKYPCVYPDGRAKFRVMAPDAHQVQVGIGKPYDMVKGDDGAWTVTTAPLMVGFHYYSLAVDGAVEADSSTRTFFGSGWDNSGIEIPEAADVDYYLPKDVPHGQVSQRWYYSKVTGQWRRCYVYTPPDYDAGKTRYPVLYLMHGWGENEQGWHTQGHADLILDNLIAAKKARPMIIVMDNLNAVKPGEDGTIFTSSGLRPPPRPATPPAAGGQATPPPPARSGLASFTGATFTEMMLTDLIPMIERTYRVLPGRENRAMAGLSMGGFQTFLTTLSHLDQFAYIGGFSGSTGGFGGTFDPKTSNNGVFADAAAFNQKVKVLFLGIGSVEGPGARNFSEQLTQAGIHNVFFESPGTAHEWLTWRRCLKEFAPLLFW